MVIQLALIVSAIGYLLFACYNIDSLINAVSTNYKSFTGSKRTIFY